jgi:hypothetical protein
MLSDLAEFIKWSAKKRNRVPSQPSELAAMEPSFPAAHLGVLNEQIVYQWGIGLSTGSGASDAVLAYEKGADAKGGWVLLHDGTMKELTAAEFQAAPKARK